MTPMELMELFGSTRDAYVAEAHNAPAPTKRLSLRKTLLIAAILALTLLLVGCTYAYVQGWFTDFFASQSDTPLSDSQIEYIQENEQIIQEAQTNGGWTVELKSAICDGETGYILFGITAPEDIDLEGYHAGNYGSAYISPGNSSRTRNAVRALIVASTGWCDEELNFCWQESGRWQNDGDGLAYTLNYVIETRIEKLYPNQEMLLEDPFGPDITFTVTFDDFTLEYEDQAILESIEAKYAGQDYLVGGEELAGLHQSELLAEGEWKFTVPFNVISNETVELITEPIMTWGVVTWKLDDEPMFYQTGSGMAAVKITSFLLNPFGATITYEFEEPAFNAFIEYQDYFGYEDRYIYAVMKDGSKIALHTDSVGTQLKPETPIVLSEVDHILFGSGEQLFMP